MKKKPKSQHKVDPNCQLPLEKNFDIDFLRVDVFFQGFLTVIVEKTRQKIHRGKFDGLNL